MKKQIHIALLVGGVFLAGCFGPTRQELQLRAACQAGDEASCIDYQTSVNRRHQDAANFRANMQRYNEENSAAAIMERQRRITCQTLGGLTTCNEN